MSAVMERLAMDIAIKAHKDQYRVGGDAYIIHPTRVALAVFNEGTEARQVALLHDVVEDSDVTLADLREKGFSEAVVEAVDAVTKRDGEIYLDFVRRAASHPLGRLVKRADVLDNLADLARMDEVDPDRAAFQRKRYAKAIKILEEEA